MIPHGFIPAVEKGVLEAMREGAVAGYPVKGVRVKLFDGSYHTVDSSEMAFKLAGSIAMRQALEQAGAVLLEPIMLATCSVPDESVGDVMGDLSSRRGRPLGTEAVGGMTEVKAEVPMSEMLTYAPDLRAMTGGQGEYTLEFLRYEEIPAHLAQKVADKAREEAEAVRIESAPCGEAGEWRIATLALSEWLVPGTSARTSSTSPATSAGARCCAASTPSTSSPAASAGGSATCAPRAPSTRAGSASPAPTTSSCATRATRGARSSTACAPAGASACARTQDDELEPAEALAPARAVEPAPRASVSSRGASSSRRPRREASRSHIRAVPTNAELKMQRAIDVFNASDHTRTVGGVARSLGAPGVCVRPRPDRPAVVSITVMWELSLVPLRGRPLRRGRRRPARRAGRRAVRADSGGAGRQRRGRRTRRTSPRSQHMTDRFPPPEGLGSRS